MPRLRTRVGFSLIEFVFVLAILAVISAIAIPRYSRSLERYRADAAARKLVADLAYARGEAVATRTSRTVAFAPNADTYVLLGVRDPDHDVTPYVIALAPERLDLVSAVFDDPNDADELTSEVVFDGFGVPDSDGAVVLGAGGASRTVVLTVTGQAEVQ